MTSSGQFFVGRTAVVTGATSGIGRSIARHLAVAGAEVMALGRNEAALARLASESEGVAGRVIPRRIDLADEGQLRNLAGEVHRESGGVDVLVHSAGVFARGPVEGAPISDFDRQMDLNVRVPYLLTQLLLPALRAREGQVLFVNSSAGLRSHSGVSQYASGKFALKAIADALREEVNAEGIRVTSVYPGRTATPMQEEVRRLEGGSYHPETLIQPDDIAQLVLGILLLPRTAEVTEVVVRPMRKA
jgi:NADP-dependent 3-hydroxy acid dehydrogenase YdfG